MKKPFSSILIILFLLILSSCETNYSTSELKSNFTNDQISDLTKIVEFFKENVCTDKNADLNSCYKQANHDSLQANGTGIWTKIDFKDQKKFYEQISQSTFNEIWMYCESTYYPSEIKSKDICAVATGKYQKYLSDLGKTNPRIAKYADRIEASGDFNGFDIQYHEILKTNSDFDLNDHNIQLILAVHCLSMNDREKRNSHLIERKEPKFE